MFESPSATSVELLQVTSSAPRPPGESRSCGSKPGLNNFRAGPARRCSNGIHGTMENLPSRSMMFHLKTTIFGWGDFPSRQSLSTIEAPRSSPRSLPMHLAGHLIFSPFPPWLQQGLFMVYFLSGFLPCLILVGLVSLFFWVPLGSQ